LNSYMKIKYLYGSLCLAVISFLIFSAFAFDDKKCDTQGNEKIIKFSHKVHKELTECQTCHPAAATSVSMKDTLLPAMADCKSCHDIEDNTKCGVCHYENIYEKLVQPKSEINFDHKLHVVKQQKKCEECHKGIGEVEYASQAKDFNPEMETCYACHNNKGPAPAECKVCHVSTANLMPQSHKVVNFKRSHKFAASDEEKCMMCHGNNACESCHTADMKINEKNTGKDFFKPYAPDNFVDGTKQQKITRAHDLNYRFTHGLDVKTGIYECSTCHQTETFCVECHQSKNADYSMGGIKPASHKKADFFTIGVGTGGGEHATLARRDIESCASCHDTQGGDPNCITCHVDPDGIKGTNPRTHKTGFMKDEHGDWHTSNGAPCFSCHRDANAHPNGTPGIGFCGYCHGTKK